MEDRRRAVEFLLGIAVNALTKRSQAAKQRKREFSNPVATRSVVLTGTFYSDNWLLTHVAPLAAAEQIDTVYMVASRNVPECPGVVGLYPGKFAKLFLGGTLARLLLFHRTVKRVRPLYAGGFHLLLNGLIALLSASSAGVKSMYFCGGGEREVLGGGYATENRIFRLLRGPSVAIERKLLQAVNLIDLTLVMGNGAKKFLVDNGVQSKIAVHPGGIDATQFQPGGESRDFDFIFVGRLSQVKRVDLFLLMLSRVMKSYPDAKAALVGDGPLLDDMKEYAESLQVEANTTFVGWTDDVAHWLRNSKIFVMTSESEGLSQALIQAGLCGLPAIVTDVGDLSDLVANGSNGYLIDDASTDELAELADRLLSDPQLLARMSDEASKAASAYTIDAAATKWNALL